MDKQSSFALTALLVAVAASAFMAGHSYYLSKRMHRLTGTMIDYWSRREDVEGAAAIEAKEEIQ